MKFNISFILALYTAGLSAVAQPLEGLYRITPWAQNKNAAACITFDDNCPGQFDYALPQLNQRNLKATFFIITGGSQCGLVNWAKVDSAHTDGHEIGSHSVTHIQMTNSDSLTIENELGNSYQTLRQRYYPQGWKMTIAYPFGRGGGSSAQDKKIRRLAEKYYYGGRSAGIGASGFTGYNDYTNPFYNSFYLQLGTYVMGPGNLPTAARLSEILDSTIKKGGLFTGLYHGIENGGFNNLPISTFQEHLDSMVARKKNVWITPFGSAIKYHTERRAEPKLAAGSLTSFGPNMFYIDLKLTDTLSGPWFDEPLTIRMVRNPFIDLSGIDSLSEAVTNVVFESDTIQFDLRPGDSARAFITFVSNNKLVSENENFTVFPNPFQNSFTINFRNSLINLENYKFRILDLNGRLVEICENWVKTKNEIAIKPVIDLNSGNYILEVYDKNKTWRKRITKY